MSALNGFIVGAFPSYLTSEIEKLRKLFSGRRLEEIRLRRGKNTELVFSGTSILLSHIPCGTELDDIFYRLCGGSVYAHEESICEGFIRAPGGIRIGVCGRSVLSGDRISAVYDISSLNIRIPSTFMPDVSELSDVFASSGGGMLLFSPPGVGKTTVLRALAIDLGGRLGKRVSVIDTRGEIGFALGESNLRCDIFDGYPKDKGIEIATRTFSPDVIICDEIGSEREARSILYAGACGVPIIATCHGKSIGSVVSKKGISELHSARLFASYVLIERSCGQGACTWTIFDRAETESILKDDNL